MADEEQSEDRVKQLDLSIIIRGIEDIQNSLSKISPEQLVQELETLKMWVINKQND